MEDGSRCAWIYKGKKGNAQIQSETLEIQQELLVELYVNVNMVMQHINKHYGEKEKERKNH